MKVRLSIWLFVMLLGACKKEDAAGTPTQQATGAPRLVILGFDGADPRLVDTLMAQNKLPNVQRLTVRGFRGALATTNPPQSPVAWSTFATGTPPGEHGVFDFVGRDPKTYFPKIATTVVEHASVDGDDWNPASAENLRLGDAFWDVCARAGVAARTLQVPYAYPPPTNGARSLAGLGVPDVRGINSSFTLLTTDAAKASGEPPAGGQNGLLTQVSAELWQGSIEGPKLRVNGTRQSAQVPILVRRSGAHFEIELEGSKHVLKLGETSPYVRVTFAPVPKHPIVAWTRITLRKAPTPLELYVEPLSNAPEQPYFPISEPKVFAQELWQKIGPFKTVGWSDDTSGLGAGAIDEEQFLKEAYGLMGWQKKALLASLDDNVDRLIVTVFTSPDRIAHMFYRYLDPTHPARQPGDEGRFTDALERAYLIMDEVIGAALDKLRPNDTLLVMSDHGFGSFRRGFHMNRWLLDNGFLALKAGVKKPRDFFQDIDWQKTQAYALGTGGIFVNRQGREGLGSVPPANVLRVAKQIAEKIVTAKDGSVEAVRAAYLSQDIFAGAAQANSPEVRVALLDGYRASWETSLGGVPDQLFGDNTKKWSGDHASLRPQDVPGILFSSHPIAVQNPHIMDFAATAYAYFQIPIPPATLGRPLFDTRRTP